MSNILFIGYDYGTSAHRAEALRRLGHQVQLIVPWTLLPRGRLVQRALGKLIWEVGGSPLEPYVRPRLLNAVKGRSYDLIWVDGGELLGVKILTSLRSISPCIVN